MERIRLGLSPGLSGWLQYPLFAATSLKCFNVSTRLAKASATVRKKLNYQLNLIYKMKLKTSSKVWHLFRVLWQELGIWSQPVKPLSAAADGATFWSSKRWQSFMRTKIINKYRKRTFQQCNNPQIFAQFILNLHPWWEQGCYLQYWYYFFCF